MMKLLFGFLCGVVGVAGLSFKVAPGEIVDQSSAGVVVGGSVADLKALLDQISRMGASHAGTSVATAATAVTAQEAALRRKFEQAQITHMRAANPYEDSTEIGIEQAIRSAMKSGSGAGAAGTSQSLP